MKLKFSGALCAVLSAAIAASSSATSTPAGFTDDMKKAVAEAAKGQKPIIAVFTGSDWCKYCKILESNVLSKPEFVRDASKEFALLFIDNPQNKNLLSPEARAVNPKLAEDFGVQGFPSVMLLDCLGQKVDRIGHGSAGPAEFLVQARAACERNAARLATAKEIASMKKGSAKRLKRIAEEIDKIDVSKHKEYPAYCAELLAKGGVWKKHLPYQSLVQPLEREFYKLAIDAGTGRSGGNPSTYIRKAKAILRKIDAMQGDAPAGLKGEIDKLKSNVDDLIKRLEEAKASKKGAKK
ncbi:MAG: thioredoxin family protein [Kiritimatiellae bacterium]|nr:thioredoxin family protein [Kiritimatiellia bacterium]